MPTITVTSGVIGTAVLTLTANTVTVIQFADDLDWVEVITATPTPADIWWTSDGVTPAAGVGWYIPSGAMVADRRPTPSGPATVRVDHTSTCVKLWSTGTPSVRVQRSQS